MQFRCKYEFKPLFLCRKDFRTVRSILDLYRIKGHLETKLTVQPLEHHSRISSNFPLWLGCRYFLEPDMYCKFFHIHVYVVCTIWLVMDGSLMVRPNKEIKWIHLFAMNVAMLLQEDRKKCQLFHSKECCFLQEVGEEAGRGMHVGICKEKLFDLDFIRSDLLQIDTVGA